MVRIFGSTIHAVIITGFDATSGHAVFDVRNSWGGDHYKLPEQYLSKIDYAFVLGTAPQAPQIARMLSQLDAP